MSTSVVSVRIDNYTTSKRIRRLFKGGKRKEYEYLNILERWVISVVNNKASQEIYYFQNKHLPHNEKLLQELKDKNIGNTPEDLQHAIIVLNNYAERKNTTVEAVLDITKKTICLHLGKRFTIKVLLSPEKIKELSGYDSYLLAQLVLRYESMFNRGQQWSLPKKQHNWLYDKYGVKYEGFASPFNSGLSDKKDGKFCSVFKEDAAFGSIGNFFGVKLYPDVQEKVGENKTFEDKPNKLSVSDNETFRHWVINPPFVESIMAYTTNKIEEDLKFADENNMNVMVVYIMPEWNDFIGWQNIRHSKYLKHTVHMGKRKHVYEHGGREIIVPIRSTMFVLDTYSVKKDYSNIAKQMIIG